MHLEKADVKLLPAGNSHVTFAAARNQQETAGSISFCVRQRRQLLPETVRL